MSIDIYQPCPCHSGRKIKFCCGKDIVTELNEIIELSSGRQLLAALDHINRAIQKVGVRDCLLTLKTHFLIKLGELEQAHETNEQFVASNPGNSIGHQHRATLYASEGKIEQAVASLQDALDRLPGDEVPISLSNGFRLVGLALLNSGDVFAARAHLRYAIQLRGNHDVDDMQRLMMESYRMPWNTILLKEDMRLTEPPAGTSWDEEFTLGVRLSRQGQWRQAIRKFEAIDEEHPGQLAIHSALAAMHGCLADRENLVKHLRLFANHQDAIQAEAIEAEILAQYFDPEPASDLLDLVQVVWTIKDSKELATKWHAIDRLIDAGPIPTDESDGPPPTAAYVILDRPELGTDKIANPESIDVDDIPTVLGNLLIFGRQTDREPRVETFLVRDAEFDKTVADISELVGDMLVGEPAMENQEQVLLADHTMSWDWHIPVDVPMDIRRKLMGEKSRQVILEKWVEIPFTALGGKTPNSVIGDDTYVIPLAALAHRLEYFFESQPDSEKLLSDLAAKLQLPGGESINPEETDPFSISAIRQADLEFAKLNDEQIEALFTHGMMIGNYPVLRKLIPELVSREHLAEQISFPQALTILARVTVDNEEAFEHLKNARQIAANQGDTLGKYLVLELDIRMERGVSDKCESLMRELQGRHLNEPDVEMMLVQVLSRHGLIRSDGRPTMEDGVPEMAPPAEESGVWTPDSGAAESSSGEGKLWLPGD